MTRFILWRIAQFPLVLLAIYLLTFAMVWLAPGSPFGDDSRKLNPQAKAELEGRFHAQSSGQFLVYYLGRLVGHGDFGPSMTYDGFTVGDVLSTSLPISITLGLFGLTIATFGGCLVGTAAAVGRGGPVDLLAIGVSLLGVSLPAFVTAGLLVALLSDHFHLFPGGGWGSFRQMVLPAVALSLAPLAYIAQLTRVALLDVLGEDYVRTARAKGLPRWKVIWRHGFRNAVLPVFTYLGPAAAAALTGSFVVELVFNIPGLGQHFVNGVKNRDQTLVLGTVMVYSFFLLGLNLIVDVGYAFVDPRIDVAAGK